MLRRIIILSNLFSLAAAWYFASQPWASITIIESKKFISVSGAEAYQQLSFVLLTGLLILWLSRYLNSSFLKFLTSSIVIFLLAAASPVWFDSASGSVSILNPQIAKVTGISDWSGQVELIENANFNHFAADMFIISLIVWSLSLIFVLWSKKPGQNAKQFVTRIDKLPEW